MKKQIDHDFVYEYLYCNECNIYFGLDFLQVYRLSLMNIHNCPKCRKRIIFDKNKVQTFTEAEVAKLLLMGRWYD